MSQGLWIEKPPSPQKKCRETKRKTKMVINQASAKEGGGVDILQGFRLQGTKRKSRQERRKRVYVVCKMFGGKRVTKLYRKGVCFLEKNNPCVNEGVP